MNCVTEFDRGVVVYSPLRDCPKHGYVAPREMRWESSRAWVIDLMCPECEHLFKRQVLAKLHG